MNTADASELWRRLKALDLITGEAPPASAMTAPWFVRVMLGVAGWIGAVFLLLFVGLALSEVIKSSAASFIVGLIACTTAGVLFRAKPDSDFATQFALAVSLSGQALVLFALAQEMKANLGVIALSMSVFQAVLFFTIPNSVHRVWSAWTGGTAVVFALTDWHLHAYAPGLLSVACAWIWLNEFQYAKNGAMLRAGGYGLVLTLMGAAGMAAVTSGAVLWEFGDQRVGADSAYHVWFGAGMSGIVLLWAVHRLLVREAVLPGTGASWRILAAASILAVASLKAPGLAPATLILLLGYANGNRVLVGLGVVALLSYLSFYYYSLEVTLLHKSALMVATGVALLAVRLLLQKWWPPTSPQEG